MKKLQLLALLWLGLNSATLTAQIAAGPMLGYAEMTETLIWLQAEYPCEVAVRYWPEDESQSATEIKAQAQARNAHVVKLIPAGLQPGTNYQYEVLVDGKIVSFDYPLQFKTLALWQHRHEPPDFKMLAGSCHYANEPEFDRPGRPFGSDSPIFNHMADQQPELMLWLGDNVYLREPDWNTRNGFIHRYSHTRSQPNMQRFLASCHHYAIWDDHDFGPNDSNGSFAHKETALEVFKLFWGNAGYGVQDVPSITTQFRHHDVDFFLLDNRYFRTDYGLKTVPAQILGKAQIDWLIQALKYSKTSFKIVAIGGQFLNSAAVYENHANYPEEREEIIWRIAEEGLDNVVFLTGDRHHAELSKVEHNGVVIYDFTSSPLTAGVFPHEEANDHRVKDTKYIDRNFASLSFSGPRKSRKLTMELFSEKGEQIWKHEIERVKR